LADGMAVGETLKETRRELLNADPADPWVTAHAFVCFGDPRVTLSGSSVATPTPIQNQPVTVDSKFAPLFRFLAVSGPEEGRVIPIFPQALEEGQAMTLGSPGLKTNEIELDDPEIPNRAASLEPRQGGLLLTNLSPSRDIRVNGLLVREVFLFGGETIEMGESVLRFERAARTERSEEREALEGRYYLEVVKGLPQDQNKRFPLKQGVTLAGRLPECPVQLSDPAVSRQHLFFTLRQESVSVSHVGSNPTAVNGVLLDRERELEHGDTLQLSEATALRFLDSRLT
ncbi:MAG: FHA domain-containing protein, partial [Candidatus Eremiobacterota bacterium]